MKIIGDDSSGAYIVQLGVDELPRLLGFDGVYDHRWRAFVEQHAPRTKWDTPGSQLPHGAEFPIGDWWGRIAAIKDAEVALRRQERELRDLSVQHAKTLTAMAELIAGAWPTLSIPTKDA